METQYYTRRFVLMNNQRVEDISNHYDDITNYMFWMNKIRNLGKTDPTFHKILLVPEKWRKDNPKELPSNYLHDIILSSIDIPSNPFVLDAGCGYGGTAFWFYKKLNGTYHGITVSSIQSKYAKQFAINNNMNHACMFFIDSFDNPRNQKYDIVIAIESLLHSRCLSRTLTNLSDCLKIDGKLIIVDDMLLVDHSTTNGDFNYLLKEWSISNFPTYHQYIEEIEKNNLEITIDRDLSSIVSLIGKKKISMIKIISKFLEYFPNRKISKIGRFHYAQMVTHSLQHEGKTCYRMIIAEKKEARNEFQY